MGAGWPVAAWIARVRLWDVASGELRHVLHHHTNLVQQVCFCPDGQRLVSSSFDQTLCLWDVASGALLASWPTQNTTYLAMAVHPNGKIIAAGGRDHITRLVAVETWRGDRGTARPSAHGRSRRLHPGGGWHGANEHRLLVTAGHDETIKLWEVSADRQQRQVRRVCLATLRAPGPYAGMNITGVTGISEAQKAALMALGAVEE